MTVLHDLIETITYPVEREIVHDYIMKYFDLPKIEKELSELKSRTKDSRWKQVAFIYIFRLIANMNNEQHVETVFDKHLYKGLSNFQLQNMELKLLVTGLQAHLHQPFWKTFICCK